MLRTSVIAFFCSILMFASCKEEPKVTPQQLSEHIEAINDTLSGMGEKWALQLRNAAESKDFAQLATIRKDMISYIDNRINWLRRAELPEETEEQRKCGEHLVNAEIDFLNSERHMINEVMAPFEEFDKMTTEEEMEVAINKMMNATMEEREMQVQLYHAQYNYALKNDFDFNPAKTVPK